MNNYKAFRGNQPTIWQHTVDGYKARKTGTRCLLLEQGLGIYEINYKDWVDLVENIKLASSGP